MIHYQCYIVATCSETLRFECDDWLCYGAIHKSDNVTRHKNPITNATSHKTMS
jgi:hypothetical protein